MAQGALNIQSKGTKGSFARIREQELSNVDKLLKKLMNQIDMIDKRIEQIKIMDDIDRMFEMLTQYCLSLNTVETHVKKGENADWEKDMDGEAYELHKFNEALDRRSQMDKIGSRFHKAEFKHRESFTLIGGHKYEAQVDNWHKRVLSGRYIGKSPLTQSSNTSTPFNAANPNMPKVSEFVDENKRRHSKLNRPQTDLGDEPLRYSIKYSEAEAKAVEE